MPPEEYSTLKVTLKKDSPFTTYYENLLILHKNARKEDEAIFPNRYYNPKLFDLIVKQLHIMPLWSGCMIHFDLNSIFDTSKNSRLTNNPVENYFGYLKNNIFDKQNKLLPSEFVAPNYKRLKSIFFEFHEDCIQDEKLPAYFANQFEEKWLDSKSKKKAQKKGYYYQNNSKDVFALDHNGLTVESITSSNENFLQAFETDYIEERKAYLFDLFKISTELTILKEIYFKLENKNYNTI